MVARAQSILFSRQAAADATPGMDRVLLTVVAVIACVGLLMMTSASIALAERLHDAPFYFLTRQALFFALGVVIASSLIKVPLQVWNQLGPMILLAGIFLLLLVLLPGVGKTVNGSTRWISLGLFNFQVSELVKLLMIIFMASYLSRHGERVRTTMAGVLLPMGVLAIVGLLLLAEPDFGTTVVIATTSFALLLLAGMRLSHFIALCALAGGILFALAKAAPYRWERVTSFLNPWADPFDSGFQLSQSLIAFGRGELFGVGLGSSVQKLFYLPEAHTDFIFAVLAEELGFLGALAVIVLFTLFAWRSFRIAQLAEKRENAFGFYLAVGIGLWFAFQAYVNLGVNMGVLPTKGLTLPLMSYGGSSVLVSFAAIGLLLRISVETALPAKTKKRKGRSHG